MGKILRMVRAIFITISFIMLLITFMGIWTIPGGPNEVLMCVSIACGLLGCCLLIDL